MKKTTNKKDFPHSFKLGEENKKLLSSNRLYIHTSVEFLNS